MHVFEGQKYDHMIKFTAKIWVKDVSYKKKEELILNLKYPNCVYQLVCCVCVFKNMYCYL